MKLRSWFDIFDRPSFSLRHFSAILVLNFLPFFQSSFIEFKQLLISFTIQIEYKKVPNPTINETRYETRTYSKIIETEYPIGFIQSNGNLQMFTAEIKTFGKTVSSKLLVIIISSQNIFKFTSLE